MYEFKSKLSFSKGGLDEKIALDRYAVSTVDPKDFAVGDTVVFIDDEAKGTRRVGTISMGNYVESDGKGGWRISSPRVDVVDREGTKHLVPIEHITKPLELTPQAFWARWAYGAAMVEHEWAMKNDKTFSTTETVQSHYKSEYRWLFDDYRYSPGGRIQLGLGHEYLGLPKANLTLVNCFVGPKVERGDVTPGRPLMDDWVDQWRKVLHNLRNQIEVQRRGGGYGVNITDIATVRGGVRGRVALILPASHKDNEELDALCRGGKFASVDEVGNGRAERNGREYVILVPDSIDGIVDSLNEMVTKLYEGHDVIVSFGALRPRHAPVSNIGRSSGAASWMTLFALAVSLLRQETIDAVDFAELFAFTTNLVEQGGSRRGALMLVLNVDSPVIEKFIVRKREAGRLVGANVSVGVTDAFMNRVKTWLRSFELEIDGCYDGAEVDREAHRIWSLIVESAHASAEPGVLFLGTINRESPSRHITGEIDATNPCGEEPMPPNASCNLGHNVLPAHVDGDWAKGEAHFNYATLERAVRLGVRFQDVVIDYTAYPTLATKEQQHLERRVGMGTMGLGTVAIMLGMRYGSDEHVAFCDDLYKRIAYWAYDESINLAKEKGAFPLFDYEKYVKSGFVSRLLAEFPEIDEKLRKYGIRNMKLLTQAPTGTTGTMLDNIPGMNVSTGIEPYFSWTYWRAGRLGVEEQQVELVRQYREANGLAPEDALPDYFITAMELTPSEHVRVQAAIQRWVDSSISKTANAPSTFTVDDTARLYMEAYDLGCKGVTIYVDGSRQHQVLATERGKAKIEAHGEVNESARIPYETTYDVDLGEIPQLIDAYFDSLPDPVDATCEQLSVDEPKPFVKRPQRVYGFTERINVPVGDDMTKVYVTVNVDEEGDVFEVFVNANDPAIADVANALGRTATQMLRYGGTDDNVAQVVKHLKRGQSNMYSLPSQLARLIEEVAYKGVEFPQDNVIHDPPMAGDIPREVIAEAIRSVRAERTKLSTCPECGEKAYDKVACVCKACGASKCS